MRREENTAARGVTNLALPGVKRRGRSRKTWKQRIRQDMRDVVAEEKADSSYVGITAFYRWARRTCVLAQLTAAVSTGDDDDFVDVDNVIRLNRPHYPSRTPRDGTAAVTNHRVSVPVHCLLCPHLSALGRRLVRVRTERPVLSWLYIWEGWHSSRQR